MADYGVTDAGFVVKTADVILSELNALFYSVLGNTVDLSPATPLGQMIGVMAGREVELWQGMQAIYTARDPDGAEGAGLVELCSITGTVPTSPSPSTVTVTLTGTTGTIIPSGNVVAVVVTGVTFVTQASGTLGAATAWLAAHPYLAGDIRKNAGYIYRAETDGTSAGSGGPTGTGNGIVDNTVTWNFLGAGDGYVAVLCHSSDNGPQQALAGSITVINTPISGWLGVTNVLDAELGQLEESDTDLRLRRYAELSGNGSASVDAIRAKLLRLKDTIGASLLDSASVFDNSSDATDAFGLPPHSIQAIVGYVGSPDSDVDLAVATSIFETKAAGIQTYGAVPVNVTDDQSVVHVINIDYPVTINVYVKVIGTKDSSYGGDDAVKLALTEYAQGLLPPFPGYAVGGDVYSGLLYAPVTDNVSGIVDISSITLSTDGIVYSAGPLVIGRTQIAAFDSSRITVTFT